MSSPLPPSPGAGSPSPRQLVGDLADRLGTSIPALVGGAIVVVVVAALVGLAWLREEPPPPEITIPQAVPDAPATDGAAPIAAAAEDAGPAEVTVHVAGAVVRPGVYVLPEPARVGDLLAAAGGPRPEADLDRLNLAAPASDGSRIFVPAVGEEEVPSVLGPDGPTGPGSSGGGPAGVDADGLVDVNAADAAALETLPGVGPATASAIVAHREQHGPFRQVDDLLAVRGIGEAKLAALRDLVVVGG